MKKIGVVILASMIMLAGCSKVGGTYGIVIGAPVSDSYDTMEAIGAAVGNVEQYQTAIHQRGVIQVGLNDYHAVVTEEHDKVCKITIASENFTGYTLCKDLVAIKN